MSSSRNLNVKQYNQISPTALQRAAKGKAKEELIAWPPAPPNSEGFRSVVQTTVRRTAKELGLPEGVSPPIIAIPPTSGLPTWPKTSSGVELALPDLILPVESGVPSFLHVQKEEPQIALPVASTIAAFEPQYLLEIPRLAPPPVPKYDPLQFKPISKTRQGPY